MEDEETATPPIHAWPYPVTKAHETAFKQELQHLIDIGVLCPCGMMQGTSQTFIVPKKDGQIWWVANFGLWIRPWTNNNTPCQSFRILSPSSVGMNISQSWMSSWCIVTPCGKFQYCRGVTMRLKPLPNFGQLLIKQMLADLDVNIYIDNISTWMRCNTFWSAWTKMDCKSILWNANRQSRKRTFLAIGQPQ